MLKYLWVLLVLVCWVPVGAQDSINFVLMTYTSDTLRLDTLRLDTIWIAPKVWTGAVRTEPPSLIRSALYVESASSMKEYRRLASQIGYKGSAMIDQQLRALLAEKGYEIYQMDTVVEFMNWVCAHEWEARVRTGQMWRGDRLSWGWASLRAKDYEYHERDAALRSIYTRAVPLEVLRIVRDLESSWDQDVALAFYVSDFEVKRPDPFLMVALSAEFRYVLYHWDEPYFVRPEVRDSRVPKVKKAASPLDFLQAAMAFAYCSWVF